MDKTSGEKTKLNRAQMEKGGKRALISIYLWDYKGLLGLFLLFCGIFMAVFYLYRLPLESVLYGGELCAVFGIAALALHYKNFERKYRMVKGIQEGLGADPDNFYLDGPLPGRKQLEKEYQKLIYMLCEDKKRMRGEFEAAKGDMADYYTMWVHQVKTPMSAMKLLLQTEEAGRGEMEEQLFKIEEYVNMALQYLRLDGGGDLLIKSHDLDGLVRQAVRKYAGMFIKKRLALKYEPFNCQVLTDEKWLVFVIEQILSNAIKYTKEGGVSIYMEKGGGKILVISDTGIGIGLEDQPRIFEKGFTGYNGRQDKKSTGIGLYLCRRILNMLSHSVTVESEPGKGTKIKVNLEAAPLEAE